MLLRTKNLFNLIKLLGILVILYFICRVLFYVFNYSYFSELDFSELLNIFFYAIRFDLSVIVLTNSIFIFFYAWPFPSREKTTYRVLLKWLFVVINSVALFSNCIDLAYFKYSHQRTSYNVFDFFYGNRDIDIIHLIPGFLKDYWYVLIIFSFLVVSLYYLYFKVEPTRFISWRFSDFLFQFWYFILAIGISIILYRGGFQPKPINIDNATEYTSAKNISLVISTPFSILKTSEAKNVEFSK